MKIYQVYTLPLYSTHSPYTLHSSSKGHVSCLCKYFLNNVTLKGKNLVPVGITIQFLNSNVFWKGRQTVSEWSFLIVLYILSEMFCYGMLYYVKEMKVFKWVRDNFEYFKLVKLDY